MPVRTGFLTERQSPDCFWFHVITPFMNIFSKEFDNKLWSKMERHNWNDTRVAIKFYVKIYAFSISPPEWCLIRTEITKHKFLITGNINDATVRKIRINSFQHGFIERRGWRKVDDGGCKNANWNHQLALLINSQCIISQFIYHSRCGNCLLLK